MSQSDRNVLMAAIEKVEDEERILNKLKNIVYKNTFLDGSYYVYAISYSKLFKNYAQVLEEKRERESGNVSRDNKKNSKQKAATEAIIGFSADEAREINTSFKGAMETVIPGSTSSNIDMNAFGNLATATCVRTNVPVFFDGEFDNSGEGLELATEAVVYKNKKFMHELALEAGGAKKNKS